MERLAAQGGHYQPVLVRLLQTASMAFVEACDHAAEEKRCRLCYGGEEDGPFEKTLARSYSRAPAAAQPS